MIYLLLLFRQRDTLLLLLKPRAWGFNYFYVNIISQLFNIKWEWHELGFMVDLCTQIKAFSLSLFHSHSDDRLSLAEFTLICRALFRNDKGHIYIVPPDHLEQMFAVFDKNQDGEWQIFFLKLIEFGASNPIRNFPRAAN